MCKDTKVGIFLFKCKKMNTMNKNPAGKWLRVWISRLEYLFLKPNVPKGAKVCE